jgi:hypothetical protein
MGNLFNQLKALVAIAPKSDIRYYLNGVYVTPDHMTVTDGHRILRVERETAISDSVILCRDRLDRALKFFTVKGPELAVHVDNDGRAWLKPADSDTNPERGCDMSGPLEGDWVRVATIDGRFPGVDRIVKGVDGKLPAQGTPVGMQLKYVAQMSNAIELARRDPDAPKSDALKAATFELFGPSDVVRIKAGPVTGWIMPCRM